MARKNWLNWKTVLMRKRKNNLARIKKKAVHYIKANLRVGFYIFIFFCLIHRSLTKHAKIFLQTLQEDLYLHRRTTKQLAQLAELVDALVSNTNIFGCAGSTPALGT